MPSATDPVQRGRIAEIGGPENLSFTQFAEIFASTLGLTITKKHIPLPLMRAMARVMPFFSKALARQIEAGVVMDTTNMAFDAPAFGSIQPTTLVQVIHRDYLPKA